MALGIPMPDSTKLTGTTDIKPIEVTTQEEVQKASTPQMFAWAPDQIKQVQTTLKSRTEEENKRAYRVGQNVETQKTKAEIVRYEGMIKEEENKINILNNEISTLNSEKSRVQSEIDSTTSQIKSLNDQAASLRSQASQIVIPTASSYQPTSQPAQPSTSTSYVGPIVQSNPQPVSSYDPAAKQRQIADLEARLNAVKERLVGPQLRKLEEIKVAARNEANSMAAIPSEWVESFRASTSGWGDAWNRNFNADVANYRNLPANHRLRDLVAERLLNKKFNENRSFFGDSFIRPDQYDIGWDKEYQTLNQQWMALGMPTFDQYRK